MNIGLQGYIEKANKEKARYEAEKARYEEERARDEGEEESVSCVVFSLLLIYV